MATSNGVGGSDLLREVMQRLRGTGARTRSYSVACDNVKHTLSYVHAVHRLDKAVHTGESRKCFQRTQIVEICAAREHAHVQDRKRQRETHLSYVLAVHLVGKAVHRSE